MNNLHQQEKTRGLVVDGDAALARTTALILKRKGFAVDVALDGFAAIQQIEQYPFDIVLLDIRMPGMNGVETYKRLKVLQPDIAAIMMTGFSVEERRQTSLREGALAVLTKPFDIERMIKLIEDAMQQVKLLALVVDDYPDTCALLARILQQKGYTIGYAESGEHAIALVKQQKYDLILIAVKLPAMDGLQTCLAIRKLDPAVTVVMTGYRAEVDTLVETALPRSTYACLYKPFEAEQVLALVEEIGRKK